MSKRTWKNNVHHVFRTNLQKDLTGSKTKAEAEIELVSTRRGVNNQAVLG